ncbi:hypothetical protein [Bradyrhizobium sp.]|uniref:hypothetical protein n=1 Tax=Bradyrhizobium sp. TaxID=376 RepID=UPI002E0BA0D5|nr:hypothetical protein [Bradyrhizobium sp.]
MSWRKLGHIYAPDGSLPWARSYAANPVAEHIEGDLFRIYFSSRDEQNRSSIGFVEIDINKPAKILRVADRPVLTPGDLAMFDDSGASIGCIVKAGDKRFLYYMGWHLTVSVPWQNAIGLAVSEQPNGPFVRHARFPVMPLDETDPYTISYPWVFCDNGKFRMWYGSNIAWGPVKEDMRHLIKYADSDDGIHWVRNDRIAIDFSGPEEYAICKPCVMRDADGYKMWFCARGKAYRIYYAESGDGINWRRRAEPDLSVSESGWDSEMVEYPFVFDHGGARYILYAGNAFGRTGFGLAVRAL